MDDVASARSENANLRKIQQKLLQWENKNNPLAPLTSKQIDIIENLTVLCTATNKKNSNEKLDSCIEPSTKHSDPINSPSFDILQTNPDGIVSTQTFLSWYNSIDSEVYDRSDAHYTEYYEQLLNRSKECDELLQQIDAALNSLNLLEEEFNFVSNKTSSLNTASEKLIVEQNQLNEICADIRKRLNYFTQADQIIQRLHSPTLSVSSEIFFEILNKIDECLEYLKSNPKFKDAPIYTFKYKQCLTKAVSAMKQTVSQIFAIATDQVIEAKLSSKSDEKSSDAAFAIYYGKFQATAPKAKRITSVIEERVNRNLEYEQLLMELHQLYLSQRANIMCTEIESAIKNLSHSHNGDHCALVRSSCAFMVHVCQDEHRLFYQFFNTKSVQLISYLEGLCTILYDTLRPFIIHINHLETLAEICSILRVEMIDEHVHHNPESLEAFGRTANQLLQDVQERLVFRAHLYLQSDILNYNPSPGDLAYPEKLEMMESIALSLQEPLLKRADSRASIVSVGSITSQEVDSITSAAEQQLRARTGNSPADLHGMWYPTVRRTLVCLSRLYRCVDRPIFQGLSQEALNYCIQSVSNASNQISSKKTQIDGELFEIKHLLILREQIAPFRVDFTVKETTLDFSKVKTAAYGLLQNRKQLFVFGSSNALLEFLLDGTPQVKEHLHDSRKDVDRQLKTICEQFIKDATLLLIEPVANFLEKAQYLLKQSQSQPAQPQQTVAAQPHTTTTTTPKINYSLRQSTWASPQHISSIIQETQRLTKNKLAGLQRSMQLYLSNKDTEFILFRPIRNNIIGAFVKLEQILSTNGYTNDDLIIASCPTADQISVLLSSASVLAAENRPQHQFMIGRKRSTASTDAAAATTTVAAAAAIDKGMRRISVEKRVSFDESKTIQEGPSADTIGTNNGNNTNKTINEESPVSSS